MSPFGPASRRAGLLVPLFSIPSSRSWGIGEIDDIVPLVGWLERGGQRLLQLLPINETPLGETSPYSALSAMALDPQYISVSRLEDFVAIGGEAALEGDLRDRLDRARARPTVDYAGVRAVKGAALRRSFQRFRREEWASATSSRALALRQYVEQEGWWLNDYALFRALHSHHAESPWTEWPDLLRTRQPEALETARVQLADDILFRQYLQWVAGSQWREARRQAGGVAIFGDLPFTVGIDSADVWVRQGEFALDGSVGVPPDAFSESGQDWGLPVPRWDVMAAGDFEWLRQRARRNAALFDGYRVDHLVGFYRTYFRPLDGSEPRFTPEDEPSQLALGEQVLRCLGAEGAEIIAEDLGTVPDFVRESLSRLEVPGFKVFRWERYWEREGQPFKDPLDYPAVAVATSGTHDTEPLAVWWEGAPQEEREAVLATPSLRERLTDEDIAEAQASKTLPGAARQAILETLYGSGADTLILPIQDVFGWRDRINQPATQNDSNWRWRLPWPSDRLLAEPVSVGVADGLSAWSAKYGRGPA